MARSGAIAGDVWLSPAGPLAILASDRGLRWVEFVPNGGPLHPASFPAGEGGEWGEGIAARIVAQARQELEQYFAGARREFTAPLDLSGTPFQRSVWQALLCLPYGTTTTYRELAAAVGRPAAIRAAGAANGANPISIIVPCHRVVGSNGSLTGYAGGLPIKRFLLDLERRDGS